MAEQRYFEDVQVGDEVPGFDLPLTWTTMVEGVDGSQDWNFVHHDIEFANESGHDHIFYNTGWTSGQLSRILTDYAGTRGWVSKFGFQMRRMNTNGDILHARGKVVGKEKHDGKMGAINLEVWLENEREGVTTPGNAVVLLPRRGT